MLIQDVHVCVPVLWRSLYNFHKPFSDLQEEPVLKEVHSQCYSQQSKITAVLPQSPTNDSRWSQAWSLQNLHHCQQGIQVEGREADAT